MSLIKSNDLSSVFLACLSVCSTCFLILDIELVSRGEHYFKYCAEQDIAVVTTGFFLREVIIHLTCLHII
jgi:hypothetical protein